MWYHVFKGSLTIAVFYRHAYFYLLIWCSKKTILENYGVVERVLALKANTSESKSQLYHLQAV